MMTSITWIRKNNELYLINNFLSRVHCGEALPTVLTLLNDLRHARLSSTEMVSTSAHAPIQIEQHSSSTFSLTRTQLFRTSYLQTEIQLVCPLTRMIRTTLISF